MQCEKVKRRRPKRFLSTNFSKNCTLLGHQLHKITKQQVTEQLKKYLFGGQSGQICSIGKMQFNLI